MSVRIRLKRMGRKNRPFYRIEVFDERKQRDGISLENLGHYDPHIEENDKKVVMKTERMRYWITKGAILSDTVRQFAKDSGLIEPVKGRDKKTEKEREARKKRRKVAGRCTSKRRQKMLAKKVKAASKPKAAPAAPEAPAAE